MKTHKGTNKGPSALPRPGVVVSLPLRHPMAHMAPNTTPSNPQEQPQSQSQSQSSQEVEDYYILGSDETQQLDRTRTSTSTSSWWKQFTQEQELHRALVKTMRQTHAMVSTPLGRNFLKMLPVYPQEQQPLSAGQPQQSDTRPPYHQYSQHQHAHAHVQQQWNARNMGGGDGGGDNGHSIVTASSSSSLSSEGVSSVSMTPQTTTTSSVTAGSCSSNHSASQDQEQQEPSVGHVPLPEEEGKGQDQGTRRALLPAIQRRGEGGEVTHPLTSSTSNRHSHKSSNKRKYW
jgi:hypothetical protein